MDKRVEEYLETRNELVSSGVSSFKAEQQAVNKLLRAFGWSPFNPLLRLQQLKAGGLSCNCSDGHHADCKAIRRPCVCPCHDR